MVSSLDAALSGLKAADTRLSVSAQNIANQNSTKSLDSNGHVSDTPYRPQQVDQVTLSNGAVLAQVRDKITPTNNPRTGETGVDQAEELVQQIIAAYDYKANLKTIQTQEKLLQSLLDIQT